MGQGQSDTKDGGTARQNVNSMKKVTKKSKNEESQSAKASYKDIQDYIERQYPSALNRVQDELEELKEAYEYIMSPEKKEVQQKNFCRLLFSRRYRYGQDDDSLDTLSRILFECYIPEENGTLKFESFICLYAALTCPEEEESFDLVFRVFCSMPPDYDEEQKDYYVEAGKFQFGGIRKLGISRSHASDFFINSLNITTNIRVYKSQMKELFTVFRQDEYFNWIDQFKIKYKGTQNAQQKGQQLIKADSRIQESGDFTPEEFKALDNFFEEKIARVTDIKNATEHLKKLISDRSITEKFRDRLVESFLYASDSNLYYDKKIYFKIMRLMFKERDNRTIINFIFDIFSQYSKTEIMDQKQIKECFLVFRKPAHSLKNQKLSKNDALISESDYIETPDGLSNGDIEEHFKHLLSQVSELNRGTFVEMFAEYLDYQSHFCKLRTILYCELGVRPENGAMEREIIKTILDGSLDFKGYFLKNMMKKDVAYVVERKFILTWDAYTKSNKTKKDKEGQFKLDNDGLFKTKKNIIQLIPIKLDENVIIMPSRVWSSFIKWYGKTYEIARHVVEYPNTKSAQANFNPNNLRKFSEDKKTVIELEIDMIGILTAKLLDDGNFPDSFLICHISSRMTLNDVKEKICRMYKIQDSSRTQLWMKNELLQGDEVLSSIVEDNKQIKEGMKFYLEVMLENQRWPTEDKRYKRAQKTNIHEMRTVGCFNLGNTCYMNSVIQCVANTHYFKDFFLRHVFIDNKDFKLNEIIEGSDWKYVPSDLNLIYTNQINISNPMGFEGKIVNPFTKLIEDMYVSKFACVKEPGKFKRAIGKSYEQFSGREQQDAQEFLVILLDSLHEELNIRMSKPYIEKPSSEGRDQDELGIQCWSNFLQRNWSFILFLFFGQMRSFLKCAECNTERISFDEFSTLSLPLPESSLINFKIVISLLPQEIKEILLQFDASINARLTMQEIIETNHRKQTLQFDAHEAKIQQVTKERQIILTVSLNPATLMTQLTKFLATTFPNLNIIEPHKHNQQLDESLVEIVYYLRDFDNNVEIVVPPETALCQIREGTIIFASETLTANGKNMIQEYYTANWNTLIEQNGNLLLNFYPDRDSQGCPLPDIDEAYELEVNLEEIKDQIDIEKKIQKDQQQINDDIQIEIINLPVDNTESSAAILDCEPATPPDGNIDLFAVKPPQPIDGFEVIMKEEEKKEMMFEQIDTRSRRDNIVNENQFYKKEGRNAVRIEQQQNTPKQIVNIDTQYYQFAKYQLKQPKCFNTSYSNYMWQTNQESNGVQGSNIEFQYQMPKEYLIFLKSRKIMVREVYLTQTNKYYTSTFGLPVVFLVNKSTTGRQIYEEVWMRIRYMLNLTSQKFFQDPSNLWWNQDTDQKGGKSLEYKPFVIKFVKNQQQDMQMCSLCGDSDYCFGCILKPSMPASVLFKKLQFNSMFAIDWNHDFLQLYYNPTFAEAINVDQLKDSPQTKQSEVQLTDCLKMFESVEEIPVKEGVKCETCKKPTHHSRKMGVQKVPPILIIHLKRFKIINGNKRKIDQYVNYPLYDLDMSPFLHGHDNLEERKSDDEKYDLYAIINHYGSLNGGHYTCFVKNERTNNWFSYDDSHVKEVLESKVRTQFAYILFYKRRDIMKKPLEKIYRSISLQSKDFFRGKPCKLKKKFGSKMLGYLWDRKIDSKTGVVMYHVKFDSTDFFTTADFLDFEGDRDNISDLMQRRQNGQENEEDDSGESDQEEAKKSSSDKGEGGPPKKEKSSSSGSQKTAKKKKGGMFKNVQKQCSNQ